MRRSIFLLAGLALLTGTSYTFARTIEADPNKDYHVNPEAGAWLICAAAFTGPAAPHLAHDLVLEIRKGFNLPAYVFDRGREAKEKQREQIRRIRANCPEGTPIKIFRVPEEYAVLVGGYSSMEAARKEIDHLKKLKPSQKFMATVNVGHMRRDGEDLVERAYISPFLNAFVAHNPAVPLEKPKDDPNEDALLKKLNSGESYSLLKCGKPVTLLVKSYHGNLALQPRENRNSFMELLGLGNRSTLTASGMQAHSLAEFLRSMKPIHFDAYVLHTRNYSFVTVGAFDSADDPKLKQIQQQLAGFYLRDQPPEMQLIGQPLPMKVPQPK